MTRCLRSGCLIPATVGSYYCSGHDASERLSRATLESRVLRLEARERQNVEHHTAMMQALDRKLTRLELIIGPRDMPAPGPDGSYAHVFLRMKARIEKLEEAADGDHG